MSEVKGSPESSFHSFMFGLTVGIMGALLLGTEDGRKTARKLLDSMAIGLEKNEDLFQDVKTIAGQAINQISGQEKQATINEFPPPPPPLTNRPARTSSYFTSDGQPLAPNS